MKTTRLLMVFAFISIVLLSCTSTATIIDRGIYNPNGSSSSEYSLLNIDKNINIINIDEAKVDWTTPDRNLSEQTVKLNSGIHVFSVQYHTESTYTLFPIKVIGNFEVGNEYKIKGIVTGNNVKIDIINMKDDSSVVLDLGKLRGNDPSTISQFIKYVLNPTMDEVGNTVKLENDEDVILLKPDMLMSINNKQSNTVIDGKHGFQTDMQMKEGKLYLMQIDNQKMNRDEFLEKSNYQEKAEIVLVPIICNKSTVKFKYERPESKKGIEVEFQITEIKK